MITSHELAKSTTLASAFHLQGSSLGHFTTTVASSVLHSSARSTLSLPLPVWFGEMRTGCARMAELRWCHSACAVAVMHAELGSSVASQRMAQARCQGITENAISSEEDGAYYVTSHLSRTPTSEGQTWGSLSPRAFSKPRRLFGMRSVQRKWRECLSISKAFLIMFLDSNSTTYSWIITSVLQYSQHIFRISDGSKSA